MLETHSTKALDKELEKQKFKYVDNFDDLYFGWWQAETYGVQIVVRLSMGFNELGAKREERYSVMITRETFFNRNQNPSVVFQGTAKRSEVKELVLKLLKHI